MIVSLEAEDVAAPFNINIETVKDKYEGQNERQGIEADEQSSIRRFCEMQSAVPTPRVVWSIGGVEVLGRTPAGTSMFGLLPVVPMVIVSALLMIVVLLMT